MCAKIQAHKYTQTPTHTHRTGSIINWITSRTWLGLQLVEELRAAKYKTSTHTHTYTHSDTHMYAPSFSLTLRIFVPEYKLAHTLKRLNSASQWPYRWRWLGQQSTKPLWLLVWGSWGTGCASRGSLAAGPIWKYCMGLYHNVSCGESSTCIQKKKKQTSCGAVMSCKSSRMKAGWSFQPQKCF